MIIKIIFIFIFLLVLASAKRVGWSDRRGMDEGKPCMQRSDCNTCFDCDEASLTCRHVGFMKDPYNDCPKFCNTEMVCGSYNYCVLRDKPNCLCNYTSGVCFEKPIVLDEKSCRELYDAYQVFTGISVMCSIFVIFIVAFQFKKNKIK